MSRTFRNVFSKSSEPDVGVESFVLPFLVVELPEFFRGSPSLFVLFDSPVLVEASEFLELVRRELLLPLLLLFSSEDTRRRRLRVVLEVVTASTWVVLLFVEEVLLSEVGELLGVLIPSTVAEVLFVGCSTTGWGDDWDIGVEIIFVTPKPKLAANTAIPVPIMIFGGTFLPIKAVFTFSGVSGVGGFSLTLVAGTACFWAYSCADKFMVFTALVGTYWGWGIAPTAGSSFNQAATVAGRNFASTAIPRITA